MTMPAGRYYVGDLCYVLSDGDTWDEVCRLIFDNTRKPIDGEFVLSDGRRFACYRTSHGDGSYQDQFGNEYGVDSGTIGCILLADIREVIQEEQIAELGAAITFSSDFDTSVDNDTIRFGRVQIYTGFDESDLDSVYF